MLKKMTSLVALAALALALAPLAQAVVIVDSTVEETNGWTAPWWTDTGWGILSPDVQEGATAATLNGGDTVSSSVFGSLTLEAGTYTVEFAIGDYSNGPWGGGADVNFAGLTLAEASASSIPNPVDATWELCTVEWEVLPGNVNIGNALSFSFDVVDVTANNLAFDGVGGLSPNGTGFLVDFSAPTASMNWDGGPGNWASSNWNGGQAPVTGQEMFIDAASGDSDVTLSADFNSRSVSVGENYAAALTIAMKSSTLSAAPPIRPPSMSGWPNSSTAFDGLTDPPYWIRVACATSSS